MNTSSSGNSVTRAEVSLSESRNLSFLNSKVFKLSSYGLENKMSSIVKNVIEVLKSFYFELKISDLIAT